MACASFVCLSDELGRNSSLPVIRSNTAQPMCEIGRLVGEPQCLVGFFSLTLSANSIPCQRHASIRQLSTVVDALTSAAVMMIGCTNTL